jgi:hypothetical protein
VKLTDIKEEDQEPGGGDNNNLEFEGSGSERKSSLPTPYDVFEEEQKR